MLNRELDISIQIEKGELTSTMAPAASLSVGEMSRRSLLNKIQLGLDQEL